MADTAPDLFGFAMVDSRPDDDYYPTPRAAIEPLLDREDLAGGVWEPACGEGAIARALAAAGHAVVATDLVDRGFGTGGQDFLAARRMARLPAGRPARHIVTNPPYRLARAFADRALALLPAGGLCALLLRLAFLEGQARLDRHRRRSPRCRHGRRRRPLDVAGVNGDRAAVQDAGVIAMAVETAASRRRGFNDD